MHVVVLEFADDQARLCFFENHFCLAEAAPIIHCQLFVGVDLEQTTTKFNLFLLF